MRIRINLFFIFCLLLGNLFIPKSILASAFEVDQSYKPSPAFDAFNINANLPIAQTFKPDKSNLSSAQVVITTTSSGDYTFTLILKKADTNLSSSTISQNLNASSKTLSFAFDDLPILIPGQTYALYLETDDNNAKWNYGQSGSVGGYPDGNAILSGSANAADLHFVTYGPTNTSTPPPSTDDTDNNNQADTSKLEAPTNLDAIERGSDYIELSWDEVDDARLSGYKIYYGTDRKDLDKKIDTGSKSAYTIRGLKAKTTYFFAVTAYDEDRKESVKSEILDAKTISGQTKIDPWDIVWYAVRILSVLILVGAVVFWYWWKKKHDKKNYEKEKNIAVDISTKDRNKQKIDLPAVSVSDMVGRKESFDKLRTRRKNEQKDSHRG